MSLQTLSEFAIPIFNTGVTFQNYLIDAAGEKYASVFQIPKAGTISRVGFRVGAVTSSQTLRVSLQTVDATTGTPTGTLYGGSAAGTQAAPSANTFYTVSLGTGATATKGDIVAAVVEFDSVVGNLNINGVSSLFSHSFPYDLLYTASWAKYTNLPLLALEYSDGSYADHGSFPATNWAYLSYNSGSTPDEKALRFQLPFPCRLKGAWVRTSITGNLDIVLYDASSTVLDTISIDSDQTNSSGRYNKFYFNTPQNLAANTVYRVSFKPSSTTNVGPFTEFDVASQAVLDCFCAGQQMYHSERTDGGAWTDTVTKRLVAGLIIDQFDDGTAVGGGGIAYGGLMGSLAAILLGLRRYY